MIGLTRAIPFARSMCSSMLWNSATSGSMASIRQRPAGPGIILRRCSSCTSTAISTGSYVPNGVLNTVIPICTANNTARPAIPVGGEPFALVVTPNGRISTATNTALPAIQVGHQPFDMAVTPDGRTLYVLNWS